MTPGARLLRMPVLAYRTGLSPLLGPHCRFAPTCSAYALEALAVHGALRGSWLAVRRVVRCHPFHPGGQDPVPSPRVSDDGRSTPRSTGAAAEVLPSNARLPSTARRLGAPS